MTTVKKALRGALVAVAAFAFAGAAGAAGLEARTSNAAGVTVKVTPKDVAPGSSTWAFAIVLDTHSRDLSDDLVKDSVLVDTRGTRYAPIAWEGAPPGGHHREGVLRFKALGPAPGAFELHIRRPGESAARVFRWNLK
ncbi:MAG TPA: hypothetical protein VFS80_14285 [Burkholderiales bacterium]|nr:hypothetical protein [Burkholderiales bacterium]